MQTVYDPFRITQVLKRAGKRGENKWVTIPFDQAITEIVEGGKLFAGFFALYAGLLFIVTAALLFTPLLHRLMHRFHWDEK